MNKSRDYQIHKFALESGLPLLVVNNIQTESVTVLLLTKVGSRFESISQSGIAHFLEHMFFKATKKYPSSSKLAMQIELLGGITNAFTAHEYTGYFIKVPKANYKKAIAILAELMQHPIFREEELIKERGVIFEEIKMYEDLPSEKVKDEFLKQLYPNHPLGRNIAGDFASLGKVTTTDLYEFKQKFYNPQNMLLIVAGDVNEQQITSEAEKEFTFGGEQSKPASPSFQKFDRKPLGRQFKLVERETEQVHLVLGGYGYPRNSDYEYAFKVGMNILARGFGSKLFQSIREKYGIAYYVGGGVAAYADTGRYSINAGIASDKIVLAVETIENSIQEICAGEFSQKELLRAKNYYIASVVEDLETAEDKAVWFGLTEVLGKNLKAPSEVIEQVNSVTRELLIKSWQEIISANDMLLTVLSTKENIAANKFYF